MKAEISTDGFRIESAYSGVYQQQGRMLVDRDWNEWLSIMLEHLRSIGDEAIGTGAPQHGGVVVDRAGELLIANGGGKLAAEGVLADAVRRAGTDAGAAFYDVQRALPATVRQSAGGTQPLITPAAEGILYADVWERAVTALEDGTLLDAALHGADTCFRTQRLVQFKIAGKDDLDPASDPCTPSFLPDRIPLIGNGEFNISMTDAGEAADECDPCAMDFSLERSVANLLYRLEVHRVDFDKNRQPSRVWLKWSNENGAREYRAADFASQADPNSFSYEYFSTDTERLLGMPSDDWVETEVLCGVLDPADPAATVKILPRIREWDGWLQLRRDANTWSFVEGTHGGQKIEANGNGNRVCKIKAGAMELTVDGIFVELSLAGRTFLVGDYWLALGRTRQQGTDRLKKLSILPVGVRHRYCVFGKAVFEKGITRLDVPTPHDRRRLLHPSLTCLDAGNVGYTAGDCAYLGDATTVQEALDALCKRNHWALRMSAGTGQEGYDDDVLPIEMYVEDQDGKPVAGAEVKVEGIYPFDEDGPRDLIAPLSNPGQEDVVQIVAADALGYIQVLWRLKDWLGLHKLSARLIQAPQGASASLFYTGRLVEKPSDQRFPVVTDVTWQSGETFENDVLVSFETMVGGLFIALSESIEQPDLISNDVLIMTAEAAVARLEFGANFVPLVVCTVVSVEENVIRMAVNEKSARALFNGYDKLPECAPLEGMRFRLKLLGRFVTGKSGEVLDGFVPSFPNKDRISLNLKNAGIGHASDFEAWFYVGRPPRFVLLRGVTDDQLTLAGISPNRWAKLREVAATSEDFEMFIKKFKPSPEELENLRRNFEF